MNNIISLNECSFSVLEVKTLDNISIFVPRGWLASISRYFKLMLSNGCRESYGDSCSLSYESKIILLIFNIVNSSHHGEKYLVTNFFTKLTTVQDIYNFVSALTEYQLDGILNIFDFYLSDHRLLESLICSHLIDTICMFRLKKTQITLGKLLQRYIKIIRFFDYTRISFEFTELFFECGIRTHFKIFGLWASVHQPTDIQLAGTKLLEHDFSYVKNIRKVINVIENLKNANNFKITFYEKILNSIYIYTKGSNDRKNQNISEDPEYMDTYKKFIINEFGNHELKKNSDIDNFELMLQIDRKWNEVREVNKDED